MSQVRNADGSILAVLSSFTFRNNYVATGSGATVPTGGRRSLSIQVVGVVVSASTWDVHLEGSNDGVNWTTILQHSTVTGNGAIVATGAALNVVKFVRTRVAGLTLGAAASIDVFVGLV